MHRTLFESGPRIARALRQRIEPYVYADRRPVVIDRAELPGEPIPVAEALRLEYTSFTPGPWGRPWGTTWFRFTATIPPEFRGRRVDLLVDLGFNTGGPGFQAEGLAYDRHGTPIKGVEPRTIWVPVTDDHQPSAGQDQVEIYVEAASNPKFTDELPNRNSDLHTAETEPIYTFAGAWLAAFEPDVHELALDVRVLSELADTLPPDTLRARDIVHGLNDMLDHFDGNDPVGSARQARRRLRRLLDAPANASALEVSAVAHAHIDTAWLWPVRETIRKCARSFSNVANLADDHPELQFACSSALQYQWMKQHHPAIWERIRDLVERGQFIPVGGMWVEVDAMMPSGESVVRQLTMGQRFFRDEFGITCTVGWLPDSFGYSGALPQLLRQAGLTSFMSQKMSWNSTNPFPHTTFWWEGIDGTRIFTHFPPADTYSALLTGAELARSETNHKDLGPARHALLPYGYGDGGGGPTREMLGAAHRTANLEGSPRVVLRDPAEFFAVAEADYPQAPVWVGEMYLEFHRGVWTSNVAIKQGNRDAEHLLHEAELWAAHAAWLDRAPYPYDDLDRVWQDVLLNQFHDILPGSSIGWVNREARAGLARVVDEARVLIQTATTALAGDGDTALVFNGAPVAQHGIGAHRAAAAPEPRPANDLPTAQRVDNGIELRGNGLVAVVDTATGAVRRVTVGGREVLAGPANVIHLHPDTPTMFDAWDIDEPYRHVRHVLDSPTRVEVGADGTSVEVDHEVDGSTVRQRIWVAADATRLDCETEVDWHHRETLMKVAFPLALHTDRYAAETQFGHVWRTITDNTPWDAAQFEACMHRWIHLAEPGFGVALVNRGIHGVEVGQDAYETGGTRTGARAVTARLSLVRAPRHPDPETDQGRHVFRYALLPGADLLAAARAGWQLAVPPRQVTGGGAPEPLVHIDNPAVTVAAVKLADDRSGDLVVRLHETVGGRASTTVAVPGATTARVVDLLEDDAPELAGAAAAEWQAGRVHLSLQPFQVVTLRFGRA